MHPINEVHDANCQVRKDECEARTTRSPIPQPGQEIPENERLPEVSDLSGSEQLEGDQRLIGLGIALARALQRQASEADDERSI
jgi:hypothetical protein